MLLLSVAPAGAAANCSFASVITRSARSRLTPKAFGTPALSATVSVPPTRVAFRVPSSTGVTLMVIVYSATLNASPPVSLTLNPKVAYGLPLASGAGVNRSRPASKSALETSWSSVTSCQLVPLFHSSVPALSSVVILTALNASPASTSLKEKSAPTNTYGTSSSVVTVFGAEVGGSFTALTTIRAVSVAVLKAVVPPLLEVLAVPPLVPLVWSHARNVIPGSTVPFQLALGTNRTLVLLLAANSRAAVFVGVPNGYQFVPLLVVYCHVPLVLTTSVTAIPSTAPASTSVIRSPPALEMIALTSVPLLVTSSSSMAANDMVPVLSNTGASFTALTTIRAVSVAVLKAVVPPLLEVLAVPPLVPLVWSHARNVIPGSTVPFQLALGTNRTLVLLLAANSRAAVFVGVPNGYQFVPLLVVYCHVPLVLTTSVTAIPSTAPASTSVIRSPPALEMIALTSVPLLVVLSSSIGVSDIVPELSRTGASFTAVTVTVKLR